MKRMIVTNNLTIDFRTGVRNPIETNFWWEIRLLKKN